ncbi:ImmA/IrrE family metallo-endopeptidase [Cohnella sp.]|uniref:ImmA/IrrE family metallo-endopeptidase n=1 Tax=Cohnella sp. TaxID=1883426 RepID=UPI00356259C6
MRRRYESLIAEAESLGTRVYEFPMESGAKGLLKNNRIGINSAISSLIERTCILAEEVGHVCKTVGDILDQTILANRKQELRSRAWAYRRLISLDDLIRASIAGVRNQYELAQFLDVTEPFLVAALERLRDHHGVAVYHNDYLIQLDPLIVFEPYST